MRFLFPVRSVLALAGLLSLSPQLSPAATAFEVVSIHRNPSDSNNTQIHLEKGGRLVVVNATLSTLIRNAYDVLPFQMEGKPAGFDTAGTGLSGHYDFVLHWDPSQQEDSTEPSLFTALHEQLGLKLESRKGPMKVLVIDSAEKPSEN